MNPRLFILMRTDLPSLNPGKAMAQAAHAANAFQTVVQDLCLSHPDQRAANHWMRQARQGFGTTVVLAATLDQIRNAHTVAARIGLISDVILDSTYPEDGPEGRTYAPVETCGYVFLPTPSIPLQPLRDLPLHP